MTMSTTSLKPYWKFCLVDVFKDSNNEEIIGNKRMLKRGLYYFHKINWQDSAQLFAHLSMTIEPIEEQEILNQRLARYGFLRETVTCIGDCALRAISAEFHGHDDNHEQVRSAGVARLIQYQLHYQNLLVRPEETYEQYVARMSREDEHVDAVFIFAVCEAYSLRIIELVPLVDYCIAEYVPLSRRIRKTIRIVSSDRHTDPMHVAYRVEEQEDAGDSDDEN